jgi:DNA-binding XRE family transcriptional regulator
MKQSESNQKKVAFIELRAVKGMSLDDSAKELGVSKSTLIKWDKEFKAELSDLGQLRMKILIEQYGHGLEGRIERIIRLNERLMSEIDGRNLADIPTDKLLRLYLDASIKLDQMIVASDQRVEEADESKAEGVQIIRLAYNLGSLED